MTTKTIYIINAYEHGECQGLFDDDFKLVDFWSENDACWRSEYFAGILEHLGVVEGKPTTAQEDLMIEMLNAATKDAWGSTDDDGDEEDE